jgi:hypothetical protein
MRNLLVFFGLFVFMGMLSGCYDNKETMSANNAVPINEFNKTLTLQGKIIDAVTGAGVGGSDLKVFLIQGTSNRTPSKMVSNTSDPLVGEYAFSGIPIAINTNNVAYKVVVVKTGYQTFEGEMVFDANDTTSGQNLVDTTYNWIGNILLYPIGVPAGDLTIHVVNPAGESVPSATVLMTQNINTNASVNGGTTGTSTLPGTGIAFTTLNATNNLVASFTVTTDSTGTVIVLGTSLALGASYTPIVLPLTFNGQQLAGRNGTTVVIGAGNAAQQISMADLEPTANPLYIVAASNSVNGSITSTGALALTFNRQIAFDSNGATSFTATATDGTLNATSATAAISADGFTLTLTPSFATAPALAGTTVTFAGGAASVIIQGLPGTSFNPLTVTNINNAAISATVKMIAN